MKKGASSSFSSYIFISFLYIILFITSCSPFNKNTLVQIDKNATIPILDWYPKTADFGTVTAGAMSVPQVFTLKNSGRVSAGNCSFVSISDSQNFKIISDTCGVFDVYSQGSCQVSILANPATGGIKETALSRTCSDGGVAEVTTQKIIVESSGPELSIDQLEHDFGDSRINDDFKDQLFTISNNGALAATGCTAPVLDDTTNFFIGAESCSSSTDLAAGGSCFVDVVANPQTSGLKTTTLSMSCNYGGAVATKTQKISVVGKMYNLSWSPMSFDFGSVNQGENSTSTNFIFSNTGEVDATSCSAPQLDDSNNFSIVSDNCGTNSLVIGSNCSVSIRANPQNTGALATTLSRTCIHGGYLSTDYKQISVAALGPNLSLSEYSYNFGSADVGTNSATHTFTLSNFGNGPAKGCSAATLSDAINFSITSDTCSNQDLSAGGSCSITIRGNPTSIGLKSTTMSRSCTVGGTVSTYSGRIYVTGMLDVDWKKEFNLDFNDVRIGVNSNDYNFYFRNSSNTTLTGCTTASISNTTDFTLVSDSCSAGAMAPHSLCRVQIHANPITLGSKSAQLSRTCDQSGVLQTSLTASGVSAAAVVVGMSSGWSHNCVLLNDGTVKCWGSINNSEYYSPVTMFVEPKAIQIASGGAYNCMLLNDGTVKCWGQANSSGQLGNGTTTASSTPVQVTGITNAIQVNASYSHSCALLNNGTVKCWGQNTTGQLGDGTTTNSSSPVQVTGLSNAIQISSGFNDYSNNFSCALINDGTVKCWGANYNGSLGNGTYTQSNSPVLVSGINNATQITRGYRHACALLSTNSIKCWGYNKHGELGDGTTTDKNVPVVVLGISNAVKIATSGEHNCALLSDGTAKCWGYNSYGELGDGTGVDRSTPVAVNGLSNVVNIISGQYHSCAILNTNAVKCWGQKEYGMLGDGTTTRLNTLNQVPSITNAVKVSLGDRQTCALLSDGTVKCWGGNSNGQIGDGSTTQRNTPVLVSGISNAIQIGLGENDTCALLNDGTVKCWGMNFAGELGNGNTTNQSSPVLVTGLSSVASISVGSQHSCAFLNDGTVKCWGSNGVRQLTSDLTSQNILTATAVPSLFGFTNISFSDATACSLLPDGTVKCWGYNWWGTLTNATFMNAEKPSYQLSVDGVTSVGRGVKSAHMCLIKPPGTVHCSGKNEFGQAGFNDFFIHNVTGI